MKHRIIINPKSKGSMGASLTYEGLTNWYASHNINWNGSDLDDRHRTFASRHLKEVKTYALGNDVEAKEQILSIFKDLMDTLPPVHVIDTRAQADELVQDAIEDLDFFERANELGIRMTYFLFPVDDNESLKNLAKVVQRTATKADYVVVLNPAVSKSETYKGSPFEKAIREKTNSKTITVPEITALTLRTIDEAERKHKKAYSFAEVAARAIPEQDLSILMAGEIEHWLREMHKQFDLAANLLVPDETFKTMKITRTKDTARVGRKLDVSF